MPVRYWQMKEHPMQAEEIIRVALANGQKTLSEYQSKVFLSQFGVPVTREFLATTRQTAVDAANLIGFPVVLKACGSQLAHKSDQGLVALHLSDDAAVEQAYDRVSTATGSALEGVLVQEMVQGARELVVGLNRDGQFGPCVMLGVGGVMTEIFKDMVFRMAPVDMGEACDMLSQLRASKMLGAFRGQQPADESTLCRAIMGIGQIGMRFSEIAEIDINPLIVEADGRITAVDALIVLEEIKK